MRAQWVAATVAGAWLAGGPAGAQQSTGADLFRAGPDTYAPRYDQSQRPPANPFPTVPYSIPIEDPAPRRARQSPSPGIQESRGYLSLFVQPGTAQVYLDGFFIGTVDDYAGSPGPLIDAGPHRVEIRADGYETAAFDVRILPGEVVTLREDLVESGAALARPAPIAGVPPAPGPPRTFYVIPRCYAGDTPPKAAHLPAGCRLSDLRIVPPLEEAGPGARSRW